MNQVKANVLGRYGTVPMALKSWILKKRNTVGILPDCTPACDEEAGGNKDAVVAVPVHADVLAIAASEGIGSSSTEQ